MNELLRNGLNPPPSSHGLKDFFMDKYTNLNYVNLLLNVYVLTNLSRVLWSRFLLEQTFTDWPKECVIITAYATTGATWTEEENKVADRALTDDLARSGKWHERITGYSPTTGHAEPDWAVEMALSDAVISAYAICRMRSTSFPTMNFGFRFVLNLGSVLWWEVSAGESKLNFDRITAIILPIWRSVPCAPPAARPA
ncbi:MAG: hypothetical protein RLZZ505_3302 [Verrucomicrobiota bacterium]|jgi:hypothetical protein